MFRFVRHGWVSLLLIASASGCLTPSLREMGKPDALTISGSISKDKSLSDKETSELHLAIGQELERNGYFADAADRYEKAREMDPKLQHLSRRLALLYDRAGNERRALEEYEEAIRQFPKDADLINNLGFCHYNRGRWTDAETCFRHALSVNRNHKRANINLGLAVAQQGRLEEAMDAFLQVTRPAEAKANLAFVLAAQGKKAEARALYQDALKLEPGLTIAQNGMSALDGPKKTEQLDSPIKATCGPDGCVNAVGTPTIGAATTPDMSPITIDPRSAKNARTETSETPE